MRAAYIEATGLADSIRVGELPDREPGPGQVLLKVGASAVNPIDLYVRNGTVAMPMSFPFVVNSDIAGTVEKVGPGAGRFRIGDRVWGSNQGLLGRQGSASERAVVDEDWLYPTPKNLSDVEAAAMALTGITAHLGLFEKGRLSADDVVYVAGGSGGVGSMVVQMAKAVGAKVATSAGSEEHLEICRSLGADLAINYRNEDVLAKLREFSEEGIDIWYETQREPDLEATIPLLRKRGRMILMAGRAAKPTLPLGSFYTRDCSLLGFAMFNATPAEQRRCAQDMIRWAEAGQLRPLVGQVFPLSETAQAHATLEESTLGNTSKVHGKVVIDMSR
jgi:NADPH2:quinone reductase